MGTGSYGDEALMTGIHLFRIPEGNIVYPEELDHPAEYTNRLDREYSRFAGIYDISVRLLPVWKTWTKNVLPHIEGDRVLEASFGTGYLLTQYACDYETYGIEFNQKMVEVAKTNLSRKGVRAMLQRAHVEKLPFPDEFFDTIVNTMSFSGYPNGRKAMSELHRVLKEGGVLLIVDFDYPSNRNRFGYWLTRLMEAAGDTIRDIPEILQAFDFEYREEEIGGFGAVHFYVARKNKYI